MIVACLALFVALGGFGYAAIKLKPNSVKTKNIKNGAVKESKIADGAVSTGKFKAGATAPNAANAEKLGGASAASYQGFCKAGAIKGSLVLNTSGFTTSTFQDVVGFNCFQPGNTTTSVQAKRVQAGVYSVRFIGNSGPDNSGSALVTASLGGAESSYTVITNDAEHPGETIFNVQIRNSAGTLVDGATFSLVVY